jgi:signal transduction histidine kinase
MKRAHSIKGRLSLVFLFLFLLVIALGVESLHSLSQVNDASAQIRDRWLPSTRVLGVLNDLTTDYPPAEAALLRADGGSRDAIAQQLEILDRGIGAAESAYLQIHHDPAEDDLFRRFEGQWKEYRDRVAQAQSQPPQRAPAGLWDSASKPSYDAASSLLDRLTERNLRSAREASERSDLAYRQARARIAFTILLAGLLVAGAMVHVTRSISAPLVDLAARMHRLAASEIGIEVRGTLRQDEIGEMARAVLVFRNNAIDLARNRQALAEQASVLREKLAAEQRVTQLQRNFVSMASHEFRTPLAIIDGHAQRLISMRDRLSSDQLAERARKVRHAVRRMAELIDNLIGSARLIDGHMHLNYQPRALDLTLLLREVCQLQRELTPEAQIQEPAATRIMVPGDASLLRQAFANLVSNAVKYSPHGGLIRVGATMEGEHVAVQIEDHGIGVPGADHKRIFERYYRGSNTSGIAGSGVGLHLVATIVDLHTGTVMLDSCDGEGSRFTVRLPLHPVERRDPRQERAGAELVS